MLRTMFIDMNSFFASVEQQDDPRLRGRPVGVVPTDANTTSCIAASYEAKAHGVRTGTPVWEARRLCPGIVFRIADHRRYVVMHNRIVAAIGSCVPIDRIMSIDEMSCRLIGEEREPGNADAMGRRIKAAIRETAGDYMRCSIGVGPNEVLAKVAADMHKPDGLTVLTAEALPDAPLKLTDFPGVGPRMERRLHLHGIFTVAQFRDASRKVLASVWGSKLMGEKWHNILHGLDVLERAGRRQTVSHSHILPPSLRTEDGAYGVLVRLSHKVAARLRKIDYWAGAVSVGVSYEGDERGQGWNGYRRGWDAGYRIPSCQDTPNILRAVGDLWRRRPARGVPFRVGIVLSELVPARSATPSLFEQDRKAGELSHAMDDVNREFGTNVVYFGSMFGMRDAAPTRIAWTQIPDFDRPVG